VNPEPAYTRRPTGGRLALVIIGALVATAAVALLAFAGFLHWVDNKRDDRGFFNTDTVRIAARTSAVSSENVDIDEGVLNAVGTDRLRLRVRSNTGKPVFVGVAQPEDVMLYLGDADRALLTDVEFAPFKPTYEVFRGTGEKPRPPAAERFWRASASGTGTQTIEWDPSGDWAVVLMNADASRGVDAAVSAGAKASLVDTLAWIATAAGLVVLAVGVVLIALGLRRRPQPSSPAGSAWGA
jgi:uncharacterized membrane protein YidH (DUF202 family)